ncbi:MAG: hypothetical protein WB680_08375 [Candidatus Acidiferrales bacterium]
MKPRANKPKTESQLRSEAMKMQCLDALRRDHPEVIINESNMRFSYSTGSWNNGKPHSAALPSLSLSLSEGEARMIDNSKELPAVFVKKNDVDGLVGQPNGLLFIQFGIDDALAFTSIPTEIAYRVTKFGKYAVPVKDLRFLTTFVDPTTEMVKARREKQQAEVKERFRRIEEAIENNKLKIGDEVLWTESSTGEVVNYCGNLTTNDGRDLVVVQSKPRKATYYIGDPVKTNCLRRSACTNAPGKSALLASKN